MRRTLKIPMEAKKAFYDHCHQLKKILGHTHPSLSSQGRKVSFNLLSLSTRAMSPQW
jgi:hypothetical protein